ncbi:MAG TPA: energy transducer TonB [Steroidobacteraceae bacterium]|jgi:outer membrane biosynthesis protein TonB
MNYHFFHGDFLSRRALAFSGIAAFHILIAYLLLTALVQPPRLEDTRMTGVVLPNIPPAAPPQTTPDFHPSDLSGPIPVPEPGPGALPQDQSPVVAVVSEGSPAGVGMVVAPVPIRPLGANQLPNTEDYYPPDLRRLEVQGATHVRVCVDAQGARQGEPVIEESSGNARLDLGALNIARHGRYARSVQGNTPVGNCFRFRIAFRITR